MAECLDWERRCILMDALLSSATHEATFMCTLRTQDYDCTNGTSTTKEDMYLSGVRLLDHDVANHVILVCKLCASGDTPLRLHNLQQRKLSNTPIRPGTVQRSCQLLSNYST